MKTCSPISFISEINLEVKERVEQTFETPFNCWSFRCRWSSCCHRGCSVSLHNVVRIEVAFSGRDLMGTCYFAKLEIGNGRREQRILLREFWRSSSLRLGIHRTRRICKSLGQHWKTIVAPIILKVTLFSFSGYPLFSTAIFFKSWVKRLFT